MELQLDKLKSHQIEPAKHLLTILRRGLSCVDESDTGTGKTYVASAVANALQVPTLCVVPKISVGIWQRAAKHFGDSFSVINYEMLRTGRTPFGSWENTPPPGFRLPVIFKCQCCQREVDFDKFIPCGCHPLGIHCVETKKGSWNYGRWNWSSEIKLLIFDEIHRCNSRDSLTSDKLIAARRQRIPTLGLSATLASSPLEMRSIGFMLGLHTLVGDTGFYPWLTYNGCGKIFGIPGWRWTVGAEKQQKIMARIRDQIIPSRGVRVRVQDVADFPEREITAELYDLNEDPALVDRLYGEMRDALEKLDQHATFDKDSNHPLTKLLRASQRIELLKVPVVVELAKDLLDTSYSVAVFVNFDQTLLELSRLLKCHCIVSGSVTGDERETNIARYQANEERLILLNSKAGDISISLHDLKGGFPRAGLVMPTPSAKRMRQLFGRLHREGGKSKCFYRIILANKTVEVSTHRNLQGKLTNLDALNDVDMLPESLHLTSRKLSSILGAA